MKRMFTRQRRPQTFAAHCFTAAAAITLWVCGPCAAQEFSAVVSPPRVEDQVKPGDTYRNIIEINNVSTKTARYTVQTADWTFDPRYSPIFSDALAPNSCRPWVGVEAREISVKSNAKRRYRFEVKVPADTPAGECRFAIMIEGEPQIAKGQVALPFSGRIGVIVYLAIGNAKPTLSIDSNTTREINAQRLPVLRVHNTGTMHGRLEGYLSGSDAKGKRIVLLPDNGPILPGDSRDLVLFPQPDASGKTPPTIVYPLRIKGRLDSGPQRLNIDTTINTGP